MRFQALVVAALVVATSLTSPAGHAVGVQAPGLAAQTLGVRTGWLPLDRAIARIPSYDPAVARWHVEDMGSWGAADLDTGDIYIAPRAPLDKLVSIVLHEYAHALTGYLYGGRWPAQAAADRYFGQRGEYGLEVEADCMARVQGATWTWYTPCWNSRWRDGARLLLSHRLLP